MLHRVVIGENCNNIIALRRLDKKSYGDVQYECLCGFCHKKIIRTETSLRLMTALPCGDCVKLYHLHDVIKMNGTNEIEAINIV